MNLILQAILFLMFVGGLNYLARSHSWRYDLTRYRRFSLSPETLAYLHELSLPVHIVVTSNGTDDPEIKGILREYVYATEANPAGQVTYEYVNLYEDRRKTEQYGVAQPGMVLFLCGDRRRVLTHDNFYRVQEKQAKEFVGEQAVTAAILDVSNPDRKKIYFLVGRGELRPDDVDPAHGLSVIRDELRQRNYDVETLDLSSARKIPADAALLVSVAPRDSFTGAEQEMLRQYLGAGAGKLILFAAVDTTPGLKDLLIDDWGIILDDDIILDPSSENMTEDGDLIIRAYSKHAITQTLIDYQEGLRIGHARSVRPLPGRPISEGLTVVTLAASSPTAWGEVGYRERGVAPYIPGLDIKGLPQMDPANALGIAVSSERVPVRGGLTSSVPGGKIVVFGTGDLISNARITDTGTMALFLGAVNWTVGRDASLNVPARPIERFSLSLSAGELAHLRYTLMLALPGIAALLGIAVYWARRN
ncbi:MAG TPA: GldG family protein [Opitutaceae bacterium]|jgi:hypothetical protein|nr:GldG family protein [Opitutaceae bacterium]